ncbi:MAG: heavy metal translocating P-type ATPase [Clostridiales bacterium]|nr:heavy metal translocating P-type ATPase [Clostridiales bacterium]
MTRRQKKTLIRIIISAVLFAAALAVTHIIKLTWWAELIIFLVPYLVIGYDVIMKAARNIVHGQVFDECFLMALATVGAFAVKEYPEAAAVMLFYQVGELFQSIAVGKSRKSIAALMDIRPDHANVIRDGVEVTVSPEEVMTGEEIVVRVGERVPLDGVITEGATSLNTAALTGESLPRDVGTGENVLSGSINSGSVFRMRTTGTYKESAVSKIMELVERSAERKAKSENFITKFARYYTPAVVLGALLLALIPPLLFHGEWAEWIHRALIFLVVSCPCALVISVPLSFFSGMGGASARGILVKGASFIEALSKVGTVVFDKTGTLTKGSFGVSAIHANGITGAELLDIAAVAESFSNHPIAQSIVRAHGKHIDSSRIGSLSELSGLGIKAVIDGREVYAGNRRLMESIGVSPVCSMGCSHDMHETCVHIAIGGVYAGHILISDEVKATAKSAVGALKGAGIRTVMLTGDSNKVGEEVGALLGLDEVHAGLLPEDKVSITEGMLDGKGRRTLAFVGDGINDAPVLTRADVGIAMGALGSDAAIEAADVVLTDDDPMKVSLAVRIAKKTMRIVRENIAFALLVKLAVLILGALGVANMWIAVFADVGVAVLAILNAVRAMRPPRAR